MSLQSNALEANTQLQVVSGFHSGVSLALDEGSYSIGSTAGADIVLRDPGVAAEHALLRIEGGSVRIEAVGGDLGVGDDLVSQGHGCKLRMPVEIALGEARLKLSHNGAGESGVLGGILQPVSNFMARRPMMAAGGVICAALAVSVATHEGSPPLKASDAGAEHKQLALTKAAYYSDVDSLAKYGTKAEPVAAQQSQGNVDEASTQLIAKLKSMNIHSLKVTSGDRRVIVVGNLAKPEGETWTSVQQWFDETYAGRVVLTANVIVGDSKAAPNLRLQAIWFGERPYVITEEGAHFYEGALLENGWTLQKIAEDRIVLERAGEALALTYR